MRAVRSDGVTQSEVRTAGVERAAQGDGAAPGAGQEARSPRRWRAWPGWKLGVGLSAAVGLTLRLAVWARPIATLDRLFIPDDTYYTLSIARSIAHGHGPTVDGHTLTSGFQPLQGFLMVPVYWITHNPDRALRADLLMLVLADVVSILLIGWIAHRAFGPVAAVVASGIWALSPVAIGLALGGLETSLALCTELALVAGWIAASDRTSARDGPGGRRTVWLWVGVGVLAGLAVLARVDALLLVALLGAVQLWRGPRRPLVPAAVAAALTLAPWWLWCWAILGSPIPSSGAAAHALVPGQVFAQRTISLAFAGVAGGPFTDWIRLRVRLFAHIGLGVALFVALILVLVAWATGLVVRSARISCPAETGDVDAPRRPDATAGPLVATVAVFAAGLLVFYAWFGVTWYLNRYLAPVLLAMTLVLARAAQFLASRRVAPVLASWRVALRPVAVAVLALAVVAAGVVSVRGVAEELTREMPRPDLISSATGYREPVLELIWTPSRGAVVAGEQNGAVSYYGGARGLVTVNLDGVVNPDAVRAQHAGRLGCYMLRRKVGWVLDWDLAAVALALKVYDQHRSEADAIASAASENRGQLPFTLARVRWSVEALSRPCVPDR